MLEQLSLQNFGPIRKAELEIKPLTVLVGPQATGKSMVAQLLYFFNNLPFLVQQSQTQAFKRYERMDFAPDLSSESSDAARLLFTAMNWWYGSTVTSHLTPKDFSRVSFESEQLIANLVWHDRQLEDINQGLAAHISGWNSWFGKENDIYIPAGRSLFSYLKPSSVSANTEWPGYVSLFYPFLRTAMDGIYNRQQDRAAGSIIPRPSYAYREEGPLAFVQGRLSRSMRGSIEVRRDEVRVISRQGRPGPVRSLKTETIASGQMELWPFALIMQDLIETNRTANLRIYFEEPEAHLHPEAQLKVMEVISFMVNSGGSFLVTTHSPYVLYAINNFLMANRVASSGQTLPKDIPSEVALPPEKVAAYQFKSNGTIEPLIHTETGLIDESALDRVAGEMSSSFSELQDALFSSE